jgi:hypothetical protein
LWVDDSGNWTEGITSFATNYLGNVLTGKHAGARKYRRDALSALSKLKPEDQVPLERFGSSSNVSRSIGYNKGALVVATLLRELGEDRFWAGIRKFNFQFLGRPATWADIRRSFEEASGRDLTGFFRQYVEEGQLPRIAIKSAQWSKSAQEVTVVLDEPLRGQHLIPLRLGSGVSAQTTSVQTSSGATEIKVSGIVGNPGEVYLDPDYEVIRKLDPAEWVPNLDLVRRARQLTVLVEPSEKAVYQPYIDLISGGSAPGQFRSGAAVAPAKVTFVEDLSKEPSGWDEGGVLILGNAVRSAAATLILRGTDPSLKIRPAGFSLGGREFSAANEGVLATFPHPKKPGQGVTVLLRSGEGGLPRPSILPFFPNSIVSFRGGRSDHRVDIEANNVRPVSEVP